MPAREALHRHSHLNPTRRCKLLMVLMLASPQTGAHLPRTSRHGPPKVLTRETATREDVDKTGTYTKALVQVLSSLKDPLRTGICGRRCKEWFGVKGRSERTLRRGRSEMA